ncbi:MAG: hypothetical protein A2297_07365 [Elusimicrobia bacterium RIFOXYB2_FULL_48_7]|nr:MAG: hypothetical protein A2297_07365 [Elusimicrobia bacterium RIFOXYB2_FULL_48_7]
MKNICIIGSGYVGLVSGACFAELGNKVVLIDNDEKKIAMLKKGKIPIYEPGLDKLLEKNKKLISFSSNIKEGIQNSDIIFICVGTPPHEDGSADLSNVERVATEVARNLNGYKLVVDKSTVPVETGEWVKTTIERNSSKKAGVAFDVASNPEFLREGTAIHDFLNPDRIVIGVSSFKAQKFLTDIYNNNQIGKEIESYRDQCLVLSYPQRQIIDIKTGEKKRAVIPEGLSGCGVWHIPNIFVENIDNAIANLAGIVIRQDEFTKRYIIATRIHIVSEILRLSFDLNLKPSMISRRNGIKANIL